MRSSTVLGWLLISGAPFVSSPLAWAQGTDPGVSDPYGVNGYYAAPGNYGMAYGSPSFGVPRTYSNFTSTYGAGYRYGYAPAGLLPGRYGVGIWRPELATPGYAYGASNYWSFPVPFKAAATVPSVPIGLYAPGFGPPSPPSYPAR